MLRRVRVGARRPAVIVGAGQKCIASNIAESIMQAFAAGRNGAWRRRSLKSGSLLKIGRRHVYGGKKLTRNEGGVKAYRLRCGGLFGIKHVDMYNQRGDETLKCTRNVKRNVKWPT